MGSLTWKELGRHKRDPTSTGQKAGTHSQKMTFGLHVPTIANRHLPTGTNDNKRFKVALECLMCALVLEMGNLRPREDKPIQQAPPPRGGGRTPTHPGLWAPSARCSSTAPSMSQSVSRCACCLGSDHVEGTGETKLGSSSGQPDVPQLPAPQPLQLAKHWTWHGREGSWVRQAVTACQA